MLRKIWNVIAYPTQVGPSIPHLQRAGQAYAELTERYPYLALDTRLCNGLSIKYGRRALIPAGLCSYWLMLKSLFLTLLWTGMAAGFGLHSGYMILGRHQPFFSQNNSKRLLCAGISLYGAYTSLIMSADIARTGATYIAEAYRHRAHLEL